MLIVTTLRYWHDENFSEYKSRLNALVPARQELNDTHYWYGIEQTRWAQAERTGDVLTDDWPASWAGPFWKFDADSFPRLLDYIGSRSFHDDKLVAISTAFRVYVQNDRSAKLLASLQNAVSDDSVLANHQIAQTTDTNTIAWWYALRVDCDPDNAIEQLKHEHPDPNSSSWMAKHVYKHTEQDGNLEPWNAEQVYSFWQHQTIIPATHHQLFELAIHRLLDLKNLLERGNDSPC